MAIFLVATIGAGCSRRVYRAANLPPQLIAPAPVDMASFNLSGLSDQSVSADVIQAGDVLDVSLVTDYTKLATTTTPVRVADDGTIVVPLVGRVGVAGLEVERAEQVVNAESIARGVFRSPSITVTMKQCRIAQSHGRWRRQQARHTRASPRFHFADGRAAGSRRAEQGRRHGGGDSSHRLTADKAAGAAAATGNEPQRPSNASGLRAAGCGRR